MRGALYTANVRRVRRQRLRYLVCRWAPWVAIGVGFVWFGAVRGGLVVLLMLLFGLLWDLVHLSWPLVGIRAVAEQLTAEFSISATMTVTLAALCWRFAQKSERTLLKLLDEAAELRERQNLRGARQSGCAALRETVGDLGAAYGRLWQTTTVDALVIPGTLFAAEVAYECQVESLEKELAEREGDMGFSVY